MLEFVKTIIIYVNISTIHTLVYDKFGLFTKEITYGIKSSNLNNKYIYILLL